MIPTLLCTCETCKNGNTTANHRRSLPSPSLRRPPPTTFGIIICRRSGPCGARSKNFIVDSAVRIISGPIATISAASVENMDIFAVVYRSEVPDDLEFGGDEGLNGMSFFSS